MLHYKNVIPSPFEIFDALQIEGETINQQYDRFIKVNDETAEELSSKFKGTKKI